MSTQKSKRVSKNKIKKALQLLKVEGDKLNAFLFGTASSEMIEKGIRTLFPVEGEDISQKTELSGRDVRACLYLKLVGKWKCKPFEDVAEQFMRLQVSRNRLGRNELATILMMANIIQNFPKEAVSKFFMKPESGMVNIGQETKS